VTLIRVALAGALLFGVSCELHDEGEPGIDQGVHEIGLDESMSYSSDERIPAIGSEAAVEEAELSALLEDEAFGDEAFEDEAFEDEAFDAFAPYGHKKKCTYCYKGKCYSSTHPHESKAKEKAKKDCEKYSKYSCKFYGCKKAY
jgi:hypothetical protein